MNRQSRTAVIMLGVFVLAAIFAFTWLSIQIGGWGGKGDNSYIAEFDNATGLVAQSDVKIAGISVGKVAALTLSPTEKALVTLSLHEGIKIRQGTRAVIKSKSLLGEMFLELQPAPMTAPVLSPGDRIVNTVSPLRVADIGEIIGPFVKSLDPKKVQAALDSFFSLIDDNQEALQNAGSKALNLLELMNNLLETNEKRINRILAAGDKATYKVDHFLARHGDELEQLVVAVAGAGKRIDPLLDTLEAALHQAPATLTATTRLAITANGMLKKFDEQSILNSLEILKRLLQTEGITVNLLRRSKDDVTKDLKQYKKILNGPTP